MKHQSLSENKQVRIVSCSNMMYWYSDYIGEVFEAYREESDRYWVRAPDKYSNFILKQDSKIYSDKE